MWTILLCRLASALGNNKIRLIECFLSMLFGVFGVLEMYTSLKVPPQILFLFPSILWHNSWRWGHSPLRLLPGQLFLLIWQFSRQGAYVKLTFNVGTLGKICPLKLAFCYLRGAKIYYLNHREQLPLQVGNCSSLLPWLCLCLYSSRGDKNEMLT